jgi:AcrR family transcriptional regulator
MDEMKEKIAYHSRRLFDKDGFHGTALRDVCKLANCKMPTLYYYFENKEKLFDEVVRVAFENLLPKLWAQLPKNVSSQEHDIQMVIQKKHITEDELIIYRLAMKTWLGFDGSEETRHKMMDLQQNIHDNSLKKYSDITDTQQGAIFIARHVTSIIQRIILLKDDISDEEIREEVGMIFFAAAHLKKETGKNI